LRSSQTSPPAPASGPKYRLKLQVALYSRHAIAVEVNGEPAPSDVFGTAAYVVIRVVPAVSMERVVDHRCAEQEPHLTALHAHGQQVDVAGLKQVALLHVDAIDARAEREGQSGERDSAPEKFKCAHVGGVVEYGS
jgi:hypothetical protein